MKILTTEVKHYCLTAIQGLDFLLGLLEYAFLTLNRNMFQLASLAILEPAVVMLHAR